VIRSHAKAEHSSHLPFTIHFFEICFRLGRNYALAATETARDVRTISSHPWSVSGGRPECQEELFDPWYQARGYVSQPIPAQHGQRISRTVTLSELAREAGLSAAYFSQRFKSSTGVSPHQYLLRLRICRAKKLLEESESPVIDIAMECGFQTQQHFARIFRRLTMRTPTEYRRQSQLSVLVSAYADLSYVNDASI
jgi:AraC-like DNA-binding protein